MRQFIVTGCNGYIGSHMCYELKKQYPDCHILGIDKNEKRHLRHLYDFYSNIDLAMDPISLPEGTDAVFHFAASISVEEGELRPVEYYHNNVVGSIRLLRETQLKNIKNFIFSSSAAVYGESKESTFGHLKETHPMNAFSVYGKTKQMFEEILMNVSDMSIARLRYFNACGRNVEANLYEEHNPETHLIPLLVKSKKAIIYGNDWPTRDGTCIRDYVHVIDICQAHILAYEDMCETPVGMNYAANIGSGKGYTVREVVDAVNNLIHNNQMEIEYRQRRDGDVAYLVADASFAKDYWNFTPKYNLENIIESMKI